jgi:preprotein translocase SecE subunit
VAREADLGRGGGAPVVRAPGESERKTNFIQESWAELKKVEWPGQQQLISGTAVVIVACLITGAYLYANDQVWQFVVKHLLLQ